MYGSPDQSWHAEESSRDSDSVTQFYKVPGFSLANANASTKVLVTLFLCTVLLGLAMALLQYYERAGGFGSDAAKTYVEGNEMDLEAQKESGRLIPEKTFGELVAITHEHAFSVPILVFVVLHLVGLTSISERAKVSLYVLGFLSAIATFAGPWLIHSTSPAFSLMMIASGATMTAVLTWSSFLCLYELWLVKPLSRRPPNPMFPKLREQEQPDDD